MQLEDYFDFTDPDAIRIKGHRIWIEDVLYEYVYRHLTVEQLAERFDTLSLDKIHATILYYLVNQEPIDAYLADWIAHGQRMLEEQQQRHDPVIERLRRTRRVLDALARDCELVALQ
jgi:uncharacterized protein (DUF433 family)